MVHPLGSYERPLLFGFLVVVASFVASTLYSELRDSQIDERAISISMKAVPSILHLSAARSEARQWVDPSYHAQPSPREIEETEQARIHFAEEVAAYLALVPYPEERALHAQVRAERDRLLRLDGGVSSGFTPGTAEQARRAHAVLSQALDFNARRASELAQQIGRTRRRSTALSFLLDGMSILFAVAAALSVRRIIRTYTRLLERKADELETFAGRVAHDLLSPLAPVSLALDLAARSGLRDAKVERLVEIGAASLQRVRRLVDDLLAFARAAARPGPGAQADVGAVLREVVGEAGALAQEAQSELELEDAGSLAVACSPGVLASLCSNLVRNALKYMGVAPIRRVVLRAREEGRFVRIEVQDSGPGIPLALQGALFLPYVRGADTGVPGIGLGLATVKRMAEAHGGRVGFSSGLGQGSTFWFELPRYDGSRRASS
jgi:signal transduction histidine kinase